MELLFAPASDPLFWMKDCEVVWLYLIFFSLPKCQSKNLMQGLASGKMSSVLIPAMKSLETDGTIALVAGRFYSLKLDYQELDGNATAILRWSSKSQSKTVVPSSRLYYNVTGSAISNAGRAVVVQPSVTCASTSTAFGMLVSLATVGIATTFTIILRDEYGNERRQGDLLHARVAPVSLGSLKPFPTTQGTRLAHILYPGGLTATFYDDHAAFTAGSSSVKSYGCNFEPWDNAPCARAPWGNSAAGMSWSFGAASSSCAPAFANNAYAVRWKGFVRPSTAATWTFKIDTTGAPLCTAKLSVNNGAWITAAGVQNTVPVVFPIAEEPYPIDLTLEAAGGTNHMVLSWSRDGGATYNLIPTSRLFPLANRCVFFPF